MENYHKSQVDVFVLVLEDDRDALSMPINTAIFVLNDAGIEIIDLVSACSFCKIEDSHIINLVAVEEQKNKIPSIKFLLTVERKMLDTEKWLDSIFNWEHY
ncbi:exosome complex component mtr3 [Anaeramoeba flamelloides]|uniref:Exosome complex component mtr3 n=1 Tax=Anaeramoeba flamelloides TaxID=1746091 RepID=A0AAV8A5F7_9EUKA|nr:exosome complex component mtr3 [Anaeramoeba flamelloides]